MVKIVGSRLIPLAWQYSVLTVPTLILEKSCFEAPLLPRVSRHDVVRRGDPGVDGEDVERSPGFRKLTSTQWKLHAVVAAGRTGVAEAAMADMPIVAATVTPAATA